MAEYFTQPAPLVFLGMMLSFAVVMLFVTIADAKTE